MSKQSKKETAENVGFFKKWYIYQKERFPIVAFSIYIIAIVLAPFKASYNAVGVYFEIAPDNIKYKYYLIIPMFIVCILQFLMVRITDEFKDYDEDCKYRPYRPVPRGLIKLSELKILFFKFSIIQIVLTFVFKANLINLVIMYVVFFLLTMDFFMKKFLSKHMVIGLIFDELLMPAMVLYIASFVAYNVSALFISIPFIIFIFMTYMVSWLIEIARKIRCKKCEEKGVRTYTAVFGILKATLLLSLIELIILISFIFIVPMVFKIIGAVLFGLIFLINILFISKKTHKLSKLVELSANLYVIVLYVLIFVC